MGNRSWTSLGALACTALLCTAGCQKDRLQEPGAAGGSEKSLPGASRPITSQQSPELRSSLPIEHWSPDTEAIFGIDMTQFRKSPLGSLVNNWLGTISCGDAIAEQVDQVLVVTHGADKGNPIYVFRGVSRSKSQGCESQPSVWLDEETLVLAPDWEQAALDDATTGTHRTNPRVLAAVSHIDTSAALWVAAAQPGDKKDWGETFDELRGTIVLDGGLKATFGVKFQDAEKAATAATDFESTIKSIPPFSQYFEDARAYADGPWLQTNILISRNQLEKFANEPMFSGLFPAK